MTRGRKPEKQNRSVKAAALMGVLAFALAAVGIILAFHAMSEPKEEAEQEMEALSRQEEILPEPLQTPTEENEVRESAEILPESESCLRRSVLVENSLLPVRYNYYNELSVPTHITKIEDLYYIVDCYHDQVIYSENLEKPLSEWQVLTAEMSMGHTLVSDGVVYLLDDTENHRVMIFEKADERFYFTQYFDNVGIRPHYSVYNEADETFYVWSSMTGEMYLFKREQDSTEMYLAEIKTIPELDGVYTRTFTIMGDRIYFVSGGGAVLEADLASFEILQRFPVPDSMAGMVQIMKIQNYYYITVSTDKQGNADCATILRTKSLDNLMTGEYEDLFSLFGEQGGTPYNLSEIEGEYYLTVHRPFGNTLWRFHVKDDELMDVEGIY